MIEFNVFPEGKKRIVTFSYDDGQPQDERLANLFNEYGVKGTFNLCGSDIEEGQAEELRKRYAGHEIACHTVHHGTLNQMPFQTIVEETIGNRRRLETIAQYPVVGMAYPSNALAYNEDVKQAMRMCGIAYARGGKSTMDFYLPEDFYAWAPTCHHKFASELCDRFLKDIDSYWTGPLFFIMGHSFEFKRDEDWKEMERLIKRLARNDKIWYATNIEICQYIKAQRSLIISMDETMFYNPTAIPVWAVKDKKQEIYIPAGETVRL